MPRDDATLLDIARASLAVGEFVEGFCKESFQHDFRTRSGVLYQLIIIGEAVKRLSTGFRAQHNEVPWSLIAGMRDHLIHGYDAVDCDEVWKTATTDVPSLLAAIAPLLPHSAEG
jgi:uncharacterized protein with HEPN domain